MEKSYSEATIIIFTIIILVVIIISSIFIYIKFLKNREKNANGLSSFKYKEDIDDMFKPMLKEIKLLHKEAHKNIIASNFLLSKIKEQKENRTNTFMLGDIFKIVSKECTDYVETYNGCYETLILALNTAFVKLSFDSSIFSNADGIDHVINIDLILYGAYKQHTNINFVPMFGFKNDCRNEVSMISVIVSKDNTIVGLCAGIKINQLLNK